MAKTEVITWQAPSGETVNVTPEAERILDAANAWPRTSRGEQYCAVSRGLHTGVADIDADAARKLVEAV